MEAFIVHTGVVAVLDKVNVDTDQIIPKQFLKRVERSGFGQYLFYNWRYLDDGSESTEFPLNQPEFKGASILVSGANFGCGSSREHAPWALLDAGYRVILAPSFADIFYNNCFKNGLLPIRIVPNVLTTIVSRARGGQYQLTVDLQQQTLYDDAGLAIPFTTDFYRRQLLLEGMDDIGMTLHHESAIAQFERDRMQPRI
jgi:3-isopropylmalate/(R)-2-methylmalate dehydratase small subunit